MNHLFTASLVVVFAIVVVGVVSYSSLIQTTTNATDSVSSTFIITQDVPPSCGNMSQNSVVSGNYLLTVEGSTNVKAASQICIIVTLTNEGRRH
jgi:hypothetical protein